MTTETDLRRRFWRLSVPNIFANLMVPLAGLIDLALLGHLEELDHLGGVALGLVVFDYLYWSFGFLSMGTTGLVAQAMGRQRQDGALVVALRGAAISTRASSQPPSPS
jgi:MATE family multidrug resistance protein